MILQSHKGAGAVSNGAPDRRASLQMWRNEWEIHPRGAAAQQLMAGNRQAQEDKISRNIAALPSPFRSPRQSWPWPTKVVRSSAALESRLSGTAHTHQQKGSEAAALGQALHSMANREQAAAL